MECARLRFEFFGKRRFSGADSRDEHDDIRIIEWRRTDRNGPSRIGDSAHARIGIVRDCAMTAVAVKERKFREDALRTTRRAVERERALERHRLPNRPDLYAAGDGFARGIVGVDIVMPLQLAEEIELEGDARMSRGHQPVRDELVLFGAAEMTIEADGGAHFRLIERSHAGGDVGGVRDMEARVTRKP